jgi:hypothetical protein
MDTLPVNSKTTIYAFGDPEAFNKAVRGLWHRESRKAALKFLGTIIGGLAAFFSLGGICLAIPFAVGQCLSIGFHAAWKVYKYWWMLPPLVGPAILLAALAIGPLISGIWWLFRRALTPAYAERIGVSLLLFCLAVLMAIAGYRGAREANPMLNSQPADLRMLSKSVGDQRRVLSELSESGKTLLDQLSNTEIELENAKKQLSATLLNFDMQRQAADQVTEELSRIDSRQKQIALQTEELENILHGQEPITRHDLQRANWQGLGFGVAVGFLTSLLASVVHNAFRKRNPAISMICL